ncbi:receptor-type tyrosine-protein phosphatase eta-like [Paramisgurnus dabryanus]|uniref:receptor-type tyrosine-protein phosphatase eta-like n=1 Tax=Paramisgurnus dabryanus TaxID=90735 RepID=UPI003CCFD35D
MVQIDAYTRPSKVADLSLTSTFQSITANWLLPQSNKKFNVSIKADGWVGRSNVTDQLSYTFNKLQPAKSYTVTVITLSEKSKLKSDPAERSVYTTPSGVYNLSVIKVTNESVELSWDHSGEYDFFSVHVSDVSKLNNTNESTIVISGLTPGKSYHFTVFAIVNGTTESVPEGVSTYTKPSPVLNLKSADGYETIINASWTKPNEILSGYRVCLNENYIFCNDYSDCVECSEFVNCIITTAEWINFPDKTPGTKYILCVAALTNNNEVQGEMVKIDAYTRPSKVANLSLTSTFQSINASWELNEGYKEFNVSIKADGWDGTSNVTDQTSYTFNDLQAAVNYTITVITLSEKPKLESDPVVTSMHTKPVSPVLANATVLDHTAIKVTWEVPEQLKGDSKITYNVTAHSDYWKKTDVKTVTENMFIIFNHLNSGTNYTFSVSVVAGNEESAPVFAYGMTVSNKKKVTFAVMCTSETSLYCSMNTTLTEIKEQLENKLGNEYKDVYWKLEKIDRK